MNKKWDFLKEMSDISSLWELFFVKLKLLFTVGGFEKLPEDCGFSIVTENRSDRTFKK